MNMKIQTHKHGKEYKHKN